MEKESLDLLRYPRKKVHKHKKIRNLDLMRKMMTLCEDLDGDGLHVVSDVIDSIMMRTSQEQPVLDPGTQNRINALIDELRNLQSRQQDIQQKMNALEGRPEAMQQVASLSSEMQQVMRRIGEIQAEMQNLQRSSA